MSGRHTTILSIDTALSLLYSTSMRTETETGDISLPADAFQAALKTEAGNDNRVSALSRASTSRKSPVSVSSWISEILYAVTLDGKHFLAIFAHDKTGAPAHAMLYSDSHTVKLASWVPGLLAAGMGGESVGRAYNRLVKGRGYAYTKVEAGSQVSELRSLMMQAKAVKQVRE